MKKTLLNNLIFLITLGCLTSCDVSTQARDCAILRELGYETKEVTPVDMFPKTSHTESVALLTRNK